MATAVSQCERNASLTRGTMVAQLRECLLGSALQDAAVLLIVPCLSVSVCSVRLARGNSVCVGSGSIVALICAWCVHADSCYPVFQLLVWSFR